MHSQAVAPGRSSHSSAERWATLFMLVLLVVFSLVGKNFFAVKNFSNILYFATTYAPARRG